MKPRRWLEVGTGIVIVVVVPLAVACGGTTTSTSVGAAPATSTPTPSLLAPISVKVSGQTIDGIRCEPSTHLVVHVHAHLAIFVNGSPCRVPKNIGILAAAGGGSCSYWLHSHDDDGIMHVESPVLRSFTLGNYFDIWGIALDSMHVGPVGGTVIVYLNGQRYAGDVRNIPLDAHNRVQLDVNANVAPVPFSFPPGD